MQVRLAEAATDATAIAAIYAPEVRDGYASFELEPPSSAEMAARIERTLRSTPWLVAVAGDEVIGYAYAARHRERPGYRWSVDVSTYVAEAWRGRGVGARLYRSLLALLRLQGFINVYAGVAQPNEGSMRLHRAIGMREVGTYHRVGYKHGRWYDVTWLEMAIGERGEHPAEPVRLAELLATDAGRVSARAALEDG